jgi:hypothetical protein
MLFAKNVWELRRAVDNSRALADVRTLVQKHLLAEYRSKFGGRELTGLLRSRRLPHLDGGIALAESVAIATRPDADGRRHLWTYP